MNLLDDMVTHTRSRVKMYLMICTHMSLLGNKYNIVDLDLDMWHFI